MNGGMLCRRCEVLLLRQGMARADARAAALPGAVCARCGAVLSAEDVATEALERLGRLSLMGVSHNAAPLLKAPGRLGAA